MKEKVSISKEKYKFAPLQTPLLTKYSTELELGVCHAWVKMKKSFKVWLSELGLLTTRLHPRYCLILWTTKQSSLLSREDKTSCKIWRVVLKRVPRFCKILGSYPGQLSRPRKITILQTTSILSRLNKVWIDFSKTTKWKYMKLQALMTYPWSLIWSRSSLNKLLGSVTFYKLKKH